MNRRLAIGIGVAAAVLAAGGGVAVLVWPSGPAPAAADKITSIPPDPAAKPPAVRAVVDPLDLAAAVTAAGGVDLSQRRTKLFRMVSVSWTNPAAAPRGAIQVRTRDAHSGKWTGWQTLAVAEAAADRPAEVARAHGATEPIWAGWANGVAARIAAGGALPAGLRLNLINTDVKTTGGQGGGDVVEPTVSASDSPVPTDDSSNPPVSTPPTEATVEPVPTNTPATVATTAPDTVAPPTSTTTVAPTSTTTVPVPTSTVPVLAQLPPYVSRAGWQADESLVKYDVDVAPAVKMIWVHHAGFGNQYGCADSASVVRGIQANDVHDKGLNDMGYNFLVDQCGTLFEGRKGGVTNAVIGAHTVGFNTSSAGIALLGDYTSAHPSAAAETTIAQVAAARLGAYGFSPTSTTPMTEGVEDERLKWRLNEIVTFPRISGHEDGEQTPAGGSLTECPGTYLYRDLPSIRAQSVQMITGLTAKSLAGGLWAGSAFYVRSSVTLTWAADTPSASIGRFDLLVDGKVAATLPGTARTATASLAAGRHSLAVRAVHVSGATGVTPTYQVYADVTAPTFPAAPAPNLRTGTYSTTSAPVTVSFRAADNVKLWTVTANKPAAVNLATTATSWNAAMRPGTNTTFTLTARDVPGNVRTVSVVRKANLLAETNAAKSGSWSARSSGSYLSGKALAATKKNAKLTYTFTGRSAALLFSRGAKTGQAYVYLDGKKVATVDTRSSTTLYRQALFVRSLTATKHTLAVVVVGTSGRPTVVSDGLAYIS